MVVSSRLDEQASTDLLVSVEAARGNRGCGNE